MEGVRVGRGAIVGVNSTVQQRLLPNGVVVNDLLIG